MVKYFLTKIIPNKKYIHVIKKRTYILKKVLLFLLKFDKMYTGREIYP